MGFDFTVIAPLLQSRCGFSFVFGCGVSFLVSSSVFLLMIVQQLVVILVFSQEGVKARPSIPPSWFSPWKTYPFLFFSSAHSSPRLPASLFAVLDKHVCCLCYQIKTIKSFRKGSFYNALTVSPQEEEHCVSWLSLDKERVRLTLATLVSSMHNPFRDQDVCPVWSLAPFCFIADKTSKTYNTNSSMENEKTNKR